MNNAVTNQDKSWFQQNHQTDKCTPALLKLFTSTRIDTSLALEFRRSLTIFNCNLGDDITTYDVPNQTKVAVRGEHNDDHFYFVGEGRVRLLGIDTQSQREVSAVVLEAGETFGGDDLWADRPISYRAIAASECQIARITINDLQQWYKKLPALQEIWELEAAQRQRQLFFKTCTDLHNLPSHQLKELLPYLVEIRIKPGELLSEKTPAAAGRYWIHNGELSADLEPGKKSSWLSWGYPNATPNQMAKTDLLVYHLPIENWQTACAIAPKYFGCLNPVGGEKPVTKTAKTKKFTPVKEAIDQKAMHKDASDRVSTSKQQNVAFPKPIRRIRWPWQSYPLILQQSSSDCGAACLAMVAQYWGKRFSLNWLRNLADVGRSGAGLKNLATAAETIGFHARPVRATLDKLAEQKQPWIAHWQGDHYIVVYRCDRDRILIADPAKGKLSIPRQTFIANWSGFGLLLDPTQRLKETKSKSPEITLTWFLGALTPYSSLIGQILGASLLLQMFGVVTPLFTQIILDQVVVQKSLPTLNYFVLGLLLFNIWNIGLSATRQYLLAYFSNRLDLTLIGGFISHTLLLPLKFFESRRVGDIITRVQENRKIQQFLIGQVVLAWLDMVMGLLYLGLMLYYNWQLTLLVLALIPPIVILTLVATPLLRQVSREVFNESAEQNSLLVEMLSGVATVKSVAAEREIRWRWEDRFTSTLNVGFKGQKLGISLQAISGAINTLGSTALLWYGATLVIQDHLTIGQFVAFNMMIGRVIGPFLALVGMWNQLQEVLISVERLNDVFEAEPEETPGQPMLILPRIQGEVRFDDVTFRYGGEGERNTLQNLSFEAYPGQTIAIVGRSGSGKTTLVKLLQGLYHPDRGRVLIDEHDIRHVSPASLRSQMGVVPQECFLFSGTIWDNITLYRPDFSLEEVTEVAKLAEANGFIQDLPLGYNTKVGERGSTLSGGQRQRIAIARALLGNPQILVLDEATSSLDTESERRFQANLERLSRDRTTFIIAHRLSTVRNADTILVLERGILTEQGTHDELMAQQGLYFHLAQQQLAL
jgi:HlyB family type I secretion system ABC transporter